MPGFLAGHFCCKGSNSRVVSRELDSLNGARPIYTDKSDEANNARSKNWSLCFDFIKIRQALD